MCFHDSGTRRCRPAEEAHRMTNLASNLIATARTRPDRVAIRLDEQAVSFAQLERASARAAAMLAARGVRAGDRVGLMLPNVPYFAIAYYAILRLGAVVLPMNVLLKRREV